MSFLVKLQAQGQEARGKLRPTATTVTSVTGTRRTTADGATTTTTINDGTAAGFVVETDPDPGLYECIPGLYIGSQDAAQNYNGVTVAKKRRTKLSSPKEEAASADETCTNDNVYHPGMVQLDITHVLNLFSQDQPFADRGTIYRNIFLLDIPEQSLADGCLDEALAFIHQALHPDGNSNKNKVLVHCNAGVSRSATVIIAYLMQQDAMTYDQALAVVRQNRPTAQPNRGFAQQLQARGKHDSLRTND